MVTCRGVFQIGACTFRIRREAWVPVKQPFRQGVRRGGVAGRGARFKLGLRAEGQAGGFCDRALQLGARGFHLLGDLSGALHFPGGLPGGLPGALPGRKGEEGHAGYECEGEAPGTSPPTRGEAGMKVGARSRGGGASLRDRVRRVAAVLPHGGGGRCITPRHVGVRQGLRDHGVVRIFPQPRLGPGGRVGVARAEVELEAETPGVVTLWIPMLPGPASVRQAHRTGVRPRQQFGADAENVLAVRPERQGGFDGLHHRGPVEDRAMVPGEVNPSGGTGAGFCGGGERTAVIARPAGGDVAGEGGHRGRRRRAGAGEAQELREAGQPVLLPPRAPEVGHHRASGEGEPHEVAVRPPQLVHLELVQVRPKVAA